MHSVIGSLQERKTIAQQTKSAALHRKGRDGEVQGGAALSINESSLVCTACSAAGQNHVLEKGTVRRTRGKTSE